MDVFVCSFVICPICLYFCRLGLFVGSRPLTVIGLSTLVFFLSLIGLLRFHREARIEKLWAEPGTRLWDEKSFVDRNFPDKLDLAMAIGVREPRGGDAGVLEAFAIKQVNCWC